MTARRLKLMVVAALVCTACSGGSTTRNTASTAADSTSGGQPSSSLDIVALTAAVRSFGAVALTDSDIAGDELILAMGVAKALGTDADNILRLAREANTAAIQQLASPSPLLSGEGLVGVRPHPAVAGNDLLWLFLQNDLAAVLDLATERQAVNHEDGQESNTDESSSPDPGAGSGARSTVTSTVSASVTGSEVQITIQRIAKVAVTDSTGAISFESTDDRTVIGNINVCPNAAGLSKASVHSRIAIEATSHAGAGGRVGAHTVGHSETDSSFEGHVDDDATLQSVTQDFERTSTWGSATSAADGAVGEPTGSLSVGFNGISTATKAAGEINIGSFDVSGASGHTDVSGDATTQMAIDSIGGAIVDLVTIKPSYAEAQRLWRNGRCVVVAAPGYKAETPIKTHQQLSSQHTENVDQASETGFAVSLHQRYGGETLTKEIVTELVTGDVSLDPQSLPSGSGTLTYVAPDEDGKDATVKLTSTSNRGIGTLVLTFHTGILTLQVDISGKENFADTIELVLTVSPILLTEQPDGTFAGTGQSKLVGSLGPCSPIVIETGTIALTATRALINEGTTIGDWIIAWAPIAGPADVKFFCDEEVGSALLPPNLASDFVKDLGTISAPKSGGTLTLHKDGTYGPLDATVVVTVTAENR